MQCKLIFQSPMMMPLLSTLNLHEALLKNESTAAMYKGTFPADLLPGYALHDAAKPALIVVNHGSSNTPGTHWSLLFFPRPSHRLPVFYFDSFGRSLEQHADLKNFVNRNSKLGYEYNKIQLQDWTSSSCGHFVLAVAWLLSRGVLPDSLSSYFKTQHAIHANDRILKKMIKRIYFST